MIPEPNSQVKNFNTRKLVTHATMQVDEGKCAGCGLLTRQFDRLFGWHICINCNSNEVAEDLCNHVLNPNEGIF